MITADHLRLYRESAPFFPLVLDEKKDLNPAADAAFVVIPCRPESDLIWTTALERAQSCVASGKMILWHFDFGWEALSSLQEGEATFLSYTVAIEAFIQNVWPRFKEQTLGVCVYRGAVSPIKDLGSEISSAFHQQLLSCEVLSGLLHRLISFFPESVLAFACIDLECYSSPALQTLMVAKLRLEHLHLCLKGARAPLSRMIWEESGDLICIRDDEPQVAVCIPENFNCQEWLDSLLAYMQANEAKFRLIAEARLTEEWDGINTLVALSGMVSPLGIRKLKGFEAAGGEVIMWAVKES